MLHFVDQSIISMVNYDIYTHQLRDIAIMNDIHTT